MNTYFDSFTRSLSMLRVHLTSFPNANYQVEFCDWYFHTSCLQALMNPRPGQRATISRMCASNDSLRAANPQKLPCFGAFCQLADKLSEWAQGKFAPRLCPEGLLCNLSWH